MHARFYYGHVIDSTNNAIDFSEGAGELQATLDSGSYTLTEFAAEIKKQMDSVGGLVYTVAIDRDTRKLTISSTSTFELLVSSGTRSGTSAYSLIGFTGSDQTSASSYEGDSASGSEYTTQFFPQSFIHRDNYQQATSASVNKTASGKVEVVKFGTEKFFEFDLKFVTDISQPEGGPIRNRASGISDLRDLMESITQKSRFEFMPDEDNTSDFYKVILESTQDSKEGTGFKLREQFDRGLPGYFNTGKLKLREVE